jgi:hypothetical protein
MIYLIIENRSCLVFKIIDRYIDFLIEQKLFFQLEYEIIYKEKKSNVDR